MMLLVELDASAILVEAVKDRSTEEMIRVYLHLLKHVKSAGMQPKKYVVDNKVSGVLRYHWEEM